MFKTIRSIICWVLLVSAMILLIGCIFDLARVGWNFQAYGQAKIITYGIDWLDYSFFGDYVTCSGIMLLGFVCNVGVSHFTSVGGAIIAIIFEFIVAPFAAAYLIIYKIIDFIKWLFQRKG